VAYVPPTQLTAWEIIKVFSRLRTCRGEDGPGPHVSFEERQKQLFQGQRSITFKQFKERLPTMPARWFTSEVPNRQYGNLLTEPLQPETYESVFKALSGWKDELTVAEFTRKVDHHVLAGNFSGFLKVLFDLEFEHYDQTHVREVNRAQQKRAARSKAM